MTKLAQLLATAFDEPGHGDLRALRAVLLDQPLPDLAQLPTATP